MSVVSADRGLQAGSLLVVVGAIAAALALLLLTFGDGPLSDGGRITPPAVVAGASAESNGIVSFWAARIAADPANYLAHSKLAGAYLRRARETGDVTDYARADAAAAESLRLFPEGNFAATMLLASLQNTRHAFAEAMATARQAIAIDRGEAAGYAVLGDAQLALGLYDDARVSYEKIVADAPGLTSFTRLAHILEIQNDVTGADLAWKNAFSTDAGRSAENTAWARVQYGNFHFRLGRLSEAREQYSAAADAFPGYVHSLAGTARLEAAEGDLDEAISLYEAVVDRQPLPAYVAELGDAYAASGRADDSLAQYELVIAIGALYRANGITTDLQMALFLADRDLDVEDAVRQATAVYATQPNSIYAADALAWALHQAGRSKEAIPYAERAIRLGTPDPALYFHAGIVSLSAGNATVATGYLSRANELNSRFSILRSDDLSAALESLEADARQ